MYAILILIIYNALGMLILARSAYQGIAITLAAYLGYLISIASVVSTIVFSTLVLSCITQNEVNCTQSQLVNHTMIMMIIIVFGVITNCILGFSIAFGKK
jgi:hypothetical protein